MHFWRSGTIWSATVVAYAASFIAALTLYLHTDLGYPGEAICVTGLLILGPIVLASRFGRPPLLLLATLVAIYFPVDALFESDYDTPRWSYSRIWTGVFFVLIQYIAAAIAAAATRKRRSPRPQA